MQIEKYSGNILKISHKMSGYNNSYCEYIFTDNILSFSTNNLNNMVSIRLKYGVDVNIYLSFEKYDYELKTLLETVENILEFKKCK